MYKKFKDLKKGDHIYWVGCNSKTYEPIFCEYELVTDMELIEIYEEKVLNSGKKLPIYRCFMIPINYDPNNHYYAYDGINPIEYRPGWKYNNDGHGCQDCTHIDLAKKYYLDYYINGSDYVGKINKEISKLQNKIDKLVNIKTYHLSQIENFDFNRKYNNE